MEAHVKFMNRPSFGQYRISVLLLAECSLTGCNFVSFSSKANVFPTEEIFSEA